ncbi:MAG: GTP cyclohydrolase FolE2 [Actinomycetota bacterium]|nr:GTP cyclohydrolase FolE2 [Actinomycetota bacterium]
MTLPDVQSEPDVRGIAIDEVGISGVRYPVSVFDGEHGKQDTTATMALSVSLPPEQKGSHLSRFVEILDEHAGELTPRTIPVVLRAIQQRLDSRVARLHVAFPYFLRRYAPVSRASALVDYQCGITGALVGDKLSLQLEARVPVSSVCPCSKAISDYGAHNQRGYVTIKVSPALDQDGQAAAVWLEDLIEVAEASASSPIYPLLKRADERQVTMLGYDHPVFVEDMVRSATDHLRGDPRIEAFSIEAVNDESIHNHGAFARVSWPPSSNEIDGPW